MYDPLSQLPGYVLRRTALATMNALSERLTPLDLRTVDASVLLLISANPGVTQSELCRALDIQRANMTPLAAKLSERGLIEREAVDGRSQGLALTACGRVLVGKVQVIIDGFEAELIARVPPALRPHLMPVLRALWEPDR